MHIRKLTKRNGKVTKWRPAASQAGSTVHTKSAQKPCCGRFLFVALRRWLFHTAQAGQPAGLCCFVACFLFPFGPEQIDSLSASNKNCNSLSSPNSTPPHLRLAQIILELLEPSSYYRYTTLEYSNGRTADCVVGVPYLARARQRNRHLSN